AILEKSEHNVDFHPIVDFVEASPLRIETTKEGTKILATVDGILRTVTESSLRRNLKLQDEEGISSLPDAELFKNLTLIEYSISPNQKFTFQKGQFSHQWKYLIHTIMQCISPKSTGFNEFSSNISTALVCLATNRVYNFSKMIFDGMVKNVNNKVSKFLMYPRQYTRRARIAQSSALSPVADEPASPLRDELEINRLKARVKLLEDREGVAAERSGDDASIKGRNLDEGEAAAERVSDDTEEMETVLTYMDAATVLASRVTEVPTGSGSISTAGPPATLVSTSSDVVPTAGPIFATATVIENFIPMGSKEEAERFKRKGIREDLNQLWALVKKSLSIRPPTSDKEMKLWMELKRLYEPDDENQLWTHTQNLMHALVEWKMYDTCGVHHVTSKDKEIFMLVEKDYPLRKGLAIGMISYKLQVENYSKMANDLILKIYKIARSPRQQEFSLPEEVSTANEESSHCQKKRDATAVKIALLLKSKRNCQSKSYDSFANYSRSLAFEQSTNSAQHDRWRKVYYATVRRFTDTQEDNLMELNLRGA
nr:synaptobrevin, longin-like domain protein [Tanacetum cinerariifolium]